MKIVLFGDSITDMQRARNDLTGVFAYGAGYPYVINSKLSERNPLEHVLINRGISGDRTVDLYARIKMDVWNHNPDVLSILIGVNDIWHELGPNNNGVDIVRFEKVYRMIIEDTLKVLPNIKIILCEPFVLKGIATEEKYEEFLQVKDYAKIVKKLAKEYKLHFVPLQDKFDEMAKKYGNEIYLYDGVHPHIAGATLIANQWLEVFDKEVNV